MNPLIRFADNSPSLNIDKRKDWIVVLPLGAYEQHGPHLPMDTDTIIAEGLVERIMSALPTRLPVTRMPVEPIGYSIEHVYDEGTKTLTYAQAIERWLGIINKIQKMGIRKVVILNAHGGNSPLISIVATEARIRFSILVVSTSWSRFAIPHNIISYPETEIGIHGGEIETSLMLALAPHLVKMDLAKNFSSRQSEFLRDFTYLRAYGSHSFGWSMQDLNSEGVVGNALDATCEKGESLLSYFTTCFIQLFDEVNSFDVSLFDKHVHK
ncbi:creatininase family protein [Candidatus Liberibacter africanus]|uniref:Creatinine amidohydrolase n=1 Tax=Candidatus Liberibacter africanus PTSAPSY TaxID=1277257 RepID=A0A0G3I317_LIBAF|nr:creatininase family protein [Candidatus Liberibacter africanus]AKK20276.1 creatinine amidohydrolase [Candidatus Liberibacter africanus PTSAPSY]QTP64038.1 creatininase family protein [Candidatus Liberibacter africanus]